MYKKKSLKVLLICIALLLLLVVLYSGLRRWESTAFLKPQEETQQSKVVAYDGVKYFPRQDITVLMFLGIDHAGKVADYEATYDYPAEMIALLIFDEQKEKYDLLCLNKDTVVKGSVQDKADEESNTQLALSHTFGTGREDSCENTKKAVSDLLGGITIDHYLSVNMDAIGLLNEAVGGVTVNVTEDFSKACPAVGMGEVTLNREQALAFIRSSEISDSQQNTGLEQRQQVYLRGLIEALWSKVNHSGSDALQIFRKVSDYMVTDCSFSVLNRLAEDYGDYKLDEVITLPGEGVSGQEHYEFYVDRDRMMPIVLDLFYSPLD